jgi:TolB protein
MNRFPFLLASVALAGTLHSQQADSISLSREIHLTNVRQLTSGGQNAEAYFSPDGRKLVFQSQRDSFQCDQIFMMNTDGSGLKLLSTGKGRTTCAYFMPDGGHVLYASTHLAGPECPPKPDRKKGYVWALYPSYDLFVADTNGQTTARLTDSPGYDAEAVVSPRGDKIAFTSIRSGDLEIYTMNTDGSGLTQLTHELGYDGGPFFSPDGKKIVYRAYHPKTDSEIAQYRELLAEQKIKPMSLQIWVMDADGSHKRQITENTGANFAPFMHPDGRHIIFSSNMADTSAVPMNFDLYMVGIDGSDLQRITFSEAFDGFPMFSPDGTQLVFVSSRHGTARYETNIFIADWKK